jgi:hypothetical protein
VDGLALPEYPLFHAIRADLLRRLGRGAEAARAYDAAIALTENAAQRAFLQGRRAALGAAPPWTLRASGSDRALASRRPRATAASGRSTRGR